MNVNRRAPCCYARVCFIDTHHNLKQNLPNSTSPSIPHLSILNNNLHTKCQSVFLAKRPQCSAHREPDDCKYFSSVSYIQNGNQAIQYVTYLFVKKKMLRKVKEKYREST